MEKKPKSVNFKVLILAITLTAFGTLTAIFLAPFLDQFVDQNVAIIEVSVLLYLVTFISIFLFLKHEFLSPLKKIVDRAREIKKGKFDGELEISTNQEFSELASLLNNASTEIKKLTEGLSDEVERKTADITKFKKAVEGSNDQIVITDSQGSIMYGNKMLEKITGYGIDEAMGTKAGKLWGGLMPSEFYKQMWETIKVKKMPYSGTLKNKRKNGEVYYADISIAPILGEDGEVQFFVSIERDVTKEREHARAMSEMAAIFVNSGDAIVGLDLTGKVTKWNQAAERMYGYKATEMVGKNVNLVYTEKHKDDFKQFLEKIRSGQEIKNYITERRRSDGTEFNVAITISPIREIEGGEMVGLSVTARDVTHQVEVDRMKTEFISLASHQLRTPLTSMKWFSELLLDGDAGSLTAEQTEYIKNIQISNERMIDLVNALLNISRIESGRLMVEPKPTDLSELIKGVITDLSDKLKFRKQTIEVKIDTSMPSVNIDPSLVRNVYLNLLTNSMKYSNDGSSIVVKVEKNEEFIVSTVSDNGCGIPVSEQVRVFDKFYRGSNIIKKETDGTGLGLYLVKAVVEASGGTIKFESKENVGTSFVFTLPLSGTLAKKGEVGLN